MKKIWILIIFLLYIQLCLNSDEITMDGKYFSSKDLEYCSAITWQDVVFIFSKNDFELSRKGFPVLKQKYKVIKESGVPFLTFGEKLLINKWLIFNSGDCFFAYNSNNELIYECNTSNPGHEASYVSGTYTASSFLIEKDVQYSPNNLGYFTKLGNPWVNAGRKYGTGEIIKINFSDKVLDLYFSNGYVDFKKPDLYLKNSRVKKILLTDTVNNITKTIDIDDTPDIQIISLDKETSGVEIKILDVYKGTSFKDTCINFILGQAFGGGMGGMGYNE